MTKIKSNDKVARDPATVDHGTVRLGDQSPAFINPIRAGDKVVRDAASRDEGKVRLGDQAPAFSR
jgi:hypothetical protein